MGRRIYIAIDEDNWLSLDQISAGERSRVVNVALREWAMRRNRFAAFREMDELSRVLPPASAAEVAAWIRQDRMRDG